MRISLRNLRTFPFVQDAVAAGRLRLHGWYFDLDGGELLGCDPATGSFELFVKGMTGQRPVSILQCRERCAERRNGCAHAPRA